MGINASLTIVAIAMILILLILAVSAGVVIRTFLRLERILARAEQDMGPLIFELKVALGEVQKMVRRGSKQVDRVNDTLQYLDHELRDTVDTLALPARELGVWYRALRIGWRYFFRGKH